MSDTQKTVLFWVIFVAGALFLRSVTNEPQEEATRLSEANLSDSAEIQKQLDVTRKEAEELKKEITDLKNQPPSVTYYVSAPTVSDAADKVQKTVDTSDTDKTVVVPNETEQKVDVYKVNLRNNHKIKGGVTYVDEHSYLSAGYQAGRVEGIVHIDEHGMQGASVLYTIKEW